ncbi:MAG TPA: hypothetical protein VGJ21_01675 [Terracidiphilus sp.]|jgi:hypothetical protein
MSRGNWKAALLTVAMAVLALLAWFLYQQSYPWARYGVSYTKDSGRSDSLQFLHFYVTRDGKAIKGPWIRGDELSVSFEYRAGESVPDAIIRSQVWPRRHVKLRLNTRDPSQPEFLIIEDVGLDVHYPPQGYLAD